jgi:cytoskeleton protein RodZ
VRYGLENGNSRVVLRLHRSIRVAVKGSRNHTFIDRVLGAGATYRVPNIPGVKLTVPDAGAVEVILDGNTVGFAGQQGVAARGLGLDPPSIIRRYHWQWAWFDQPAETLIADCQTRSPPDEIRLIL